MNDPSNRGYEPFYAFECACEHMDRQHHWTGSRFTYCTVWNAGRPCPCEKWAPL
jgi:hypothetical protein